MLSTKGVRFLKGLSIQREPIVGTDKFRKKIHYTGQRNKYGQIHLVRNAFFEPGLVKDKNYCVSECIDRVNNAFRFMKPAIITTHRINYIGYINEKFREENLALLKIFLTRLLKEHPDVEFITSDELGLLIGK